MRGTSTLRVIPLFVMGCTIASSGYVTTGLQPNNCGTPYKFKPCDGGGSHVSASRQALGRSAAASVASARTGADSAMRDASTHAM
jgi:hypothetical protein